MIPHPEPVVPPFGFQDRPFPPKPIELVPYPETTAEWAERARVQLSSLTQYFTARTWLMFNQEDESPQLLHRQGDQQIYSSSPIRFLWKSLWSNQYLCKLFKMNVWLNTDLDAPWRTSALDNQPNPPVYWRYPYISWQVEQITATKGYRISRLAIVLPVEYGDFPPQVGFQLFDWHNVNHPPQWQAPFTITDTDPVVQENLAEIWLQLFSAYQADVTSKAQITYWYRTEQYLFGQGLALPLPQADLDLQKTATREQILAFPNQEGLRYMLACGVQPD